MATTEGHGNSRGAWQQPRGMGKPPPTAADGQAGVVVRGAELVAAALVTLGDVARMQPLKEAVEAGVRELPRKGARAA
jgi:hypothetical protein